MAKSSSKGTTSKVSKDSKKVVPPVKEGRVTKPAQTPKVKSKEMAKSIAAKEVKKSKKAKKDKNTPGYLNPSYYNNAAACIPYLV